MQIIVIADDLTGANATGVKLAKEGFETATIVRGVPLPEENYQAFSIDTDSRYVKIETAKKRVRKALEFVHEKGTPAVYSKRIDSTLRGNIGAEMDVMLDALGENSIAIVVASFPESGRITSGGFLLVDNIPLQETDVAKDPITPLTSSKVTEIIAKQSEKKIETVDLDQVLMGSDYLLTLFQKKMNLGTRVFVVDAVTEEQIETIAMVMTKINSPVLAVDPGPLTASYSRNTLHHQYHEKKVLAAIGSITSLTGQQINYLRSNCTVNTLFVQPEGIATFTDAWNKEVNRVIKEASDQIQTGKVILVTTYSSVQNRLDLKTIAKKENVTEEGLAKRITDGLAAISREIIRKNKDQFGGCFLSGGDVTSSLCAVSHAKGIKLEDEVLPLASYGKFIGGYLDGIPIITKGGLIGNKKAISDCIRFLQSKIASGS
ncbi:four-carbon acid sugar kinase family protein [Aquibacillus sp. 3ASR75-11]|uniref:Four-carbon acid sugar kinase family protein n=1 Tax=Terrihalobacillus insolitus TaxID=2950438 RepID=A0A9X3WQP3_9BACI|nr:four-carbon acid sugar kinase family protein [Terrihalobacillus insolitus]MDC3412203.1 four-carbon acid sugar kinase family protein [Terrihalobacillus insolitus]MDC3423103.1 four-carbon acid sugar kinase family protein [Terrihalobacillus insolitus]